MDVPRADISEEDVVLTVPERLRRMVTAWPKLRAGIRYAPWLHDLSRGLLFVLIGILLIHALVYVSDTLAPDGNTRFLQADRNHVRAIMESAPTINALALGNSHTGALNMAALGYKDGYRFARADGDLFEVRHYLEQLVPKLPSLEVVFIPVSYFSFAGDNNASEEVRVRRAHMYGSLDSWRYIPHDEKNLIIGKSHAFLPVMRLLREDSWEGIAYALMGDPPEQKGFIEVAADDCTYLNDQEVQASVENRVAKYMRLAQEMKANHPSLAEDTYETVVGINQYLRSHNIQVVFFTPPYLKVYTDHYQESDPETIAQMRQLMTKLQREQSITYYDFSQDDAFISDVTLYRDSDHLNGCGARYFSAKFRQVLTVSP